MNKVLILAAVLSFLLAGCSSTEVNDLDPAELQDLDFSVELDEQWDFGLGDLREYDASRIQPVIDGDQLFVVDALGDLYALDKHTGKEIWNVELDIGVASGITAADNKLLIGTHKGKLILLSQEDGQVIWTTQLSDELLSLPQVSGDLIVVQTSGGRLYGLELGDGARRWVYEVTMPSLTVRGTASPIIYGDISIAGFSNGKIVVIDNAKGGVIWEKPVSLPKGKTELERVIDVDSTPLLRDDVIYAAAYQGDLVAIRLYSAKKIWNKEVSTFNDIAWGGTQIFVTDQISHIHAIAPDSGVSLWDQGDLHHRNLNAPVVWGEYVLVADFEGYLHIVSRSTGQLVGRESVVSGPVRSPVVVSDEMIYLISDDGQLVALKQE